MPRSLVAFKASRAVSSIHMAVWQNQWCHFGEGAVYFSGDWDVHWGYGILTHGHILPGIVNLETRLLRTACPEIPLPFLG